MQQIRRIKFVHLVIQISLRTLKEILLKYTRLFPLIRNNFGIITRSINQFILRFEYKSDKF